MKRTAVFLKLVRWPNLLFIALTQVLFYFIIFRYAYRFHGFPSAEIALSQQLFFMLMAASVLIAAGGYVINDFLDVGIDRINKPDRQIVEVKVSSRAALFFYTSLTIAGILLSAYISFRLANPAIFILNTAAALLLIFYSITLKKRLLAGNLLISLLTAWVVLVLAVAEYRSDMKFQSTWDFLFKFALFYAGFAFVASLAREVIKDMEDIRGDAAFGGRTIPVLWGIKPAKVFAGSCLIAVAVAVLTMSVKFFLEDRWPLALYGMLTVVMPIVYLLLRLNKAYSPADFHKLSSTLKAVMLTGILSMVFFLF